MEELDQFSYEYFQEDLLSLHQPDSFLSLQGLEDVNLMNGFPSVWELDTTIAIKKKLEASSQLDKINTDMSLNLNQNEFSLSTLKVEPENDWWVFVPEQSKEDTVNDEVIPNEDFIQKSEDLTKSKRTVRTRKKKIEVEDLKETVFNNPVNYDKRERFSKKYDKGKASASILKELGFLL